MVTLPEEGTLLVATDLHGNLADFRAVVALFHELLPAQASACLVIAGDLVHGPRIAVGEWPDHLGSYYRDESRQLLREAWALQRRYPAQVHYLLGNHEHAHLGGPRLSKFHPDEARCLEDAYGPAGFEMTRGWLRGWPLAAVAPKAGIVVTHAAPHAQIRAVADLDELPLDGFTDTALHEMAGAGPLGALLWARTTTAERGYAFLRAIHPQARVAVFGHDVVREGPLVEHEPLLCVSTSFGCHDGDKAYLRWDLGTLAMDADTLARDGLRRLYPAAPVVYRRVDRPNP